uniref:Reverse transcriptase domain-containing protein n=1 Tax=Anguilla anguilla TaxID=7936 RepID=A0A0E9T1B7_ANGAN
MRRGIRQGCPISGQLYSLAIEPLLCRLRGRLTGLSLPELPGDAPVSVSAYVDDINVLIKTQSDVETLTFKTPFIINHTVLIILQPQNQSPNQTEKKKPTPAPHTRKH